MRPRSIKFASLTQKWHIKNQELNDVIRPSRRSMGCCCKIKASWSKQRILTQPRL